MAKNATINFSRKGEWGGLINTIWLFSNAGIQGLNRTTKTLMTKKGARTGATVSALGFAYAAMMDGLSDDDEEDYTTKAERSNNFMIPIGDGEYIPIPKSYSGMKVFFNAGEAMYRAGKSAYKGDDKTSMSEEFLNILEDIAGQVNIIGGSSESLAGKFSPEIIKPLIEIADGKNFFGKEFIPSYMDDEEIPDSLKYYSSTDKDWIENAQTLFDLTS